MIELVIFDWAGTTVDYGCFAPVEAFKNSFSHFGINVTVDEVRKPMGMLKKDHIRTMFNMKRISDEWKKTYSREWSEQDVEDVYKQFETKLFEILHNFANPKPYVLETVKTIKNMGLKIGSTTGYTDSMMEIVVSKAKEQGYIPDFWISADSVNGKGRPNPYMIFENMKHFNISNVRNVIKIGDTVSDIKEGINAGVWTVGIIEGSSDLGLTEQEYNNLTESERETLCKKTEQNFRNAGADFVIKNIKFLPDLICSLGV